MCISVSMIPTRPPTFGDVCLQLPPSGLPSPLLRWLLASHCCLVSGLPHWQGTGKQAVPQRVSTTSEHCKKFSDLRVLPQSSNRGKGSAGAWGQGKGNAGKKELALINAQGICWSSKNISALGETAWFVCGWRLSWEKGADQCSHTAVLIAFWMCTGVGLNWISDFLGYFIL